MVDGLEILNYISEIFQIQLDISGFAYFLILV
jgi:hypothetical protein